MSMNTALDQIKARVEGHTEGPWVYDASLGWIEDVPETNLHRFDIMANHIATVELSKADGELIAAAPKLLAALEAVQALAANVPRMITFTGALVSGRVDADDVLKAIEEALR